MNYEELKKLLDDPAFNENHLVDFKADVPESSVPNLAKDISSFANAMGGRIYIGINDDKTLKSNKIIYPISRWAEIDAEELSSGTRRKIARFLSHNLSFTVTPIKRPGHTEPILIIEIFKSETICGYRREQDCSFEFWHRTDSQNSPMGIAEIINKSLGSHHQREQLIISREFAKLLKRRLGMVAIAIHIAYGEIREGKPLINQSIPESSINKIKNLKTMIIPESKKTYTNLASLAFLSANINSDLKLLAIALTNKLVKVIADNGIWNIDDKTLGMLKQREIDPQNDIRLEIFYQSNALLKDYQCLLDIEVEIDKKISDLEAAGLSLFSTSEDFNQEYSLPCSGDLPRSA